MAFSYCCLAVVFTTIHLGHSQYIQQYGDKENGCLPWSAWGKCSIGQGNCEFNSLHQTRYRHCKQHCSGWGQSLRCFKGNTFEARKCSNADDYCCPPGPWSPCTKSCGTGSRMRQKICHLHKYETPHVQMDKGICNTTPCPPNLALDKDCVQSSTYTLSHPAGCQNAVDGNTNPDFHGRSCMHSQSQPNPWWQVDLGKVYHLSHVTIVSRDDCCQHRFANVNIDAHMVTNQGDVGMRCFSNIMPSTTPERTYPCRQPTIGRYLVVSRQVANGFLELCEVLVYALPKLN